MILDLAKRLDERDGTRSNRQNSDPTNQAVYQNWSPGHHQTSRDQTLMHQYQNISPAMRQSGSSVSAAPSSYSRPSASQASSRSAATNQGQKRLSLRWNANGGAVLTRNYAVNGLNANGSIAPQGSETTSQDGVVVPNLSDRYHNSVYVYPVVKGSKIPAPVSDDQKWTKETDQRSPNAYSEMPPLEEAVSPTEDRALSPLDAEALGLSEEELAWALEGAEVKSPAQHGNLNNAKSNSNEIDETPADMYSSYADSSRGDKSRATDVQVESRSPKQKREATMHELFHQQGRSVPNAVYPDVVGQVGSGEESKALRKILTKFRSSSIDSTKWKVVAEACAELEAIAHTDSSLIVQSLTAVVTVLINEIANARASVSRAAIHCVGIVCEALGPATDIELDRIVKHLLRKSSDSGTSFVLQEIAVVMDLITIHCSVDTILQVLVKHVLAKQKDAQARMIAVASLSKLIDRADPYQVLPYMGELLRGTANHIDSADSGVKHYSIRLLFKLTRVKGWRDSMLEDHLAGSKLHISRAALLKLQDEGPPLQTKLEPRKSTLFSPTAASSRRHTHSTSPMSPLKSPSPTKKAARSTASRTVLGAKSKNTAKKEADTLTRVKGILSAGGTGGWQAREKALIDLCDVIAEPSPALRLKVAGITSNLVLPWCNDSNIKVSLSALTLVLKLIPIYHENFTATLVAKMIKTLSSQLSSTNGKIFEVTSLGLDHLIVYANTKYLVKPWVHAIETGPNLKIQTCMMEKLRKLTALGFNDCPDQFEKLVLPFACRLLAGIKFQSESKMLCRVLFAQFGESLYVAAEALPSKSQDALVKFVQSDLYRA